MNTFLICAFTHPLSSWALASNLEEILATKALKKGQTSDKGQKRKKNKLKRQKNRNNIINFTKMVKNTLKGAIIRRKGSNLLLFS